MPILSTLLGARSRKKAQRKTRKANELDRRRRTISNVLARRQALAAVRRQSSQATALAVGAGLEGGSAARNAAGNVQSQAASSIAANAQLSELDTRRNKLLESADSRNRQADRFNAVSQLATRAVGAIVTGGTSEVANLAQGGGLDFTNLTK